MNAISLLLLLTPALALDIDGVGTGTIGTNEIADLAVDTAKLGTDAVTGPKILSFVVDSNKLGTGAVKTEKIAALAIDSSKIAALAVDSEKLALGSVQKAQIGVGAVETDRLASGAVTINKIAAGAVDTSALGSGAVNTGKIENGAVQTQKLNDDAVDTKKLMYTAHRVQSLGIGAGAVAASGEALTVTGTMSTTGKVGIGVAAGADQLAVAANSPSRAAQIYNDNTIGLGLMVQTNSGGAWGFLVQDQAGNPHLTVGSGGVVIPDGKYLQSTDNNAGAPAATDCDADSERGRFSIDTTNNLLYICNGATRGWDYVSLTN